MEATLTTKEAMEKLGVSKSTIYRYCKEGKLKSHIVGRSHRFPESQIAELLGVEYTDESKPESNVIRLTPESIGDDKQAICRGLLATLKCTRNYSDLESLEYKEHSRRLEIVEAVFEDGETVKIDVTGASGMSLIRMVIRGLTCASDDGGLL